MTALTERTPCGRDRDGVSGDDDAELIRGCLAGRESAWQQLVDRYGRLVYSIPRRLGLQAGDADDVFQTVFVIALRCLHGLKQQRRLAPWLIRIAYRESWRVARKARPRLSIHDAFMEQNAEPTGAEMLQLERQHVLRQAMNRLKPASRNILDALFFSSSGRYSQVARRLGYSIGSIGPLRARAFLELERELTAVGFDF